VTEARQEVFFFGMLDAGIHLAPRRSAAPSLSAGEREMDRIAEAVQDFVAARRPLLARCRAGEETR
jgi:glutamate-1-semialdehyde 2,1-aminomutase